MAVLSTPVGPHRWGATRAAAVGAVPWVGGGAGEGAGEGEGGGEGEGALEAAPAVVLVAGRLAERAAR